MQKLLVLLLVACGGGGGGQARPTLPRLNAFIGQALVDAIGRHDEPAIAAAFQAPVAFGGLWFTDPDCTREFPTQTRVQADRLPAFAHCLATLPLQPSARRHQLGDIEVLEYAPCIEVELQFVARGDHAWITWIGYAGRRDPKDALPTITGTALAALRTGPATVVLDDATRATLEAGAKASDLPAQYAWLKICLDATGALTGVHPREITSPLAEKAFTDVARTWQFRPFAITGQAIPVCAMQRVAYPDTTAPEVLPIELAPEDGDVARIAPAGVKRLSGTKFVSPDDRDKTILAHASVSRIVTAFKVCFDGAGVVQGVTILRRSGLPNYDAKIERMLRTWTYRPILRDGKAVDVCTAVTFIYSQDGGRTNDLTPPHPRTPTHAF